MTHYNVCKFLLSGPFGSPGRRLAPTFPEAAHLPHITAKEAYVAAVLGFLGDVERAAPA